MLIMEKIFLSKNLNAPMFRKFISCKKVIQIRREKFVKIYQIKIPITIFCSAEFFSFFKLFNTVKNCMFFPQFFEQIIVLNTW